MGCWGMGMTQSDEFCEIYHEFMDSYNEGKAVAEITAAILAEYHAEFDDDDGVMHDVYFALAKAEWMCCEQSEPVLNRVKEIIESGANIEFYRELEASEQDLRTRRKNLEKFWDSLQTPRTKPRQRRIDPLDREKDLPPLEVGDCCRYKYGDGYRVFVVLGFNRAPGFRDMMRCGIFQETYSAAELKTVNFLNEPLHSITCYLGEELLAPSSIKKIASISVPEGRFTTSHDGFQVKQGHKKDFKAEFTTSIVTTPAQLFAQVDPTSASQPGFSWSDVKCGDVFAYRADGQYRVFVLLHTRKMIFLPAIYCYAWRKMFASVPTMEELKDEYVMPLGWFVEQFFPAKSKLTYIGNCGICEALKDIDPAKLYGKWSPATMAVAKEVHLTEEYPIHLCERLCDAVQRAYELTVPKSEHNTEQGEKEMFRSRKKAEEKNAPDLGKILDTLRKNEICVTTCQAKGGGAIYRSKLGGKPTVPADFAWPRFEAENYDGERANRPLSFLCQIRLEEIGEYDKENLLPHKGLLLFFYEQESMCWGFDPGDAGCSRVYYFEDVTGLAEAEFPEDMNDEYAVKEYDLTFAAQDSYPSFEELDCHSDVDCDWEDYDEAVEKKGYELDFERHKLLGYADLIQGEMLTECERTTRGLYCGDAASYQNTPEDVKADISRAAADWVLLFQMASIQEDDYELMFGDLGNLYFYIRKEDLKARRFDRVWLVVQCG